MISHDLLPAADLVEAGIQDILIVTGGNNAGDFLRCCATGKIRPEATEFCLPGGEGESRTRCGWRNTSRLAKNLRDPGDNILRTVCARREKNRTAEDGAFILLKEVPDSERFGVPVFEGKRLCD